MIIIFACVIASKLSEFSFFMEADCGIIRLHLENMWHHLLKLRYHVTTGRIIFSWSPLYKMAPNLADDIFKCIFTSEKYCVSIRISLKFVPWGTIDNRPALVQVMAYR